MTLECTLVALKFLGSFSDNILCYQVPQIILGSNGKLDFLYELGDSHLKISLIIRSQCLSVDHLSQ